MIQLDQPDEPQPTIRKGRGWRQTTPPRGSRQPRTYQDTAPPDSTWPEIETPFQSMTSMLGHGHPTDFTGPTKWAVARYAADHLTELTQLSRDETIRRLVDSADQTLNAAANRGTAIHTYLEARRTNQYVDWPLIKRCEATPWIPAVDNYLNTQPVCGEALNEVVVFDRDHMIAGSVDRIEQTNNGSWVVIDYKSRTTQHDRRSKEAAQVGGYAYAATHGYYMNQRGQRITLDHVDHCLIVTFCPDGTWAQHWIDTSQAIAAYTGAIETCNYTRIGWAHTKPAETSQPVDLANTIQTRLDQLEDDAKQTLAGLWRQHTMPRINHIVDANQYVQAVQLFEQVEPFPALDHTPPKATQQQRDQIIQQIRELPDDLKAEVAGHATGLPRSTAPYWTLPELEDWTALVDNANRKHAGRLYEAVEVLHINTHGRWLTGVLGNHHTWTSNDLERAYELVDATEAGHITVTADGTVEAAPLDLGSKREITALAKTVADEIGRPRPRKHADITTDVILTAAVHETLHQQQQAKETTP